MMKQSWLTPTLFLAILKAVDVQFAMPMFAPPPPPPPMVLMAPPPPPVHVPVGVPYPVPVPVIVTKRTTTTTTTEAPDNDNGAIGVAVPLPFAFPMPFAVPQAPPPRFCADKPRSRQCPPCPPCVCSPSCTPSFYSYCSPCHQKCRCNGNAPSPEPPRPPPPMPMPMLSPPMPMPVYPMQQGPPPVFVFPFPPAIPYRRPPRRIINESENSESSSCSDNRYNTGSDSSSSSDSDSDSDYDRRRKMNSRKIKVSQKNYRKTATNKGSMGTNEETGAFENKKKLVKPMLSYISRKGDVKFQRKISEDDAAKLIRESDFKSEEVVRRSGHSRSKDKRKVVFSPPLNKNIANLTVSFNVV